MRGQREVQEQGLNDKEPWQERMELRVTAPTWPGCWLRLGGEGPAAVPLEGCCSSRRRGREVVRASF